MSSRKRWILAGLVALVAVLAFAFFWRSGRPATIIIRNASSTELHNIVVSGRGSSVSCPSLRPGQSTSLSAQLHADTGIAVDFEAAGRKVSVPEQEYAGGGGFRITVEVGPELSVSVRSELVA
jgi:hypothetical protein